MGRSQKHKTPERLREQIAAQQNRPVDDENERTAEGEEVRTPSRGEFFGNLNKTSGPKTD